MKRNRLYFGILSLILLLIIAWASYSMLHVGKQEETHIVSVIVNDSNNDRWIALHQGLEQASDDYNIDLNFVSTGKFASVDEELALINRELENGAEGIIVQMIGEAEELEGISSRVAVMLLETDASPEGVYAFTGPDNTAIGSALADAIKEDFGEELSGKTVGILSGNEEKLSTQQRLAGLHEGLAETEAEILWTIECANEQRGNTDALQGAAPVDIVIALENDETERMVDYLQTENARMESLLYGVGCSEKAVYYLDKGVIHMLLVPNEFNMGYQSMEAMANQLHYRLTKAEDCQVDYLMVDRTNLYDEDNQKVLFPIVQ